MERYAYLLGLYLGDGCLYQYPRTWVLKVSMDRKYPGLLEECRNAIATVSPTGTAAVSFNNRDNCATVYGYSRAWPELFPQHGPGRKHNRPILLAPWQREIVEGHTGAFVRGLIHSDGWRGVNRVKVKGRWYQYPRYQFSNRSDDIRHLFTDACDRLGVEWRPWGRWHISVAKRDSVARLDEFVGLKS